MGLSIDGPADLHDANRRTRRGRGTHAGAMRAVRLLQDQGIAFHVITVLTDRALDDPDRLFDFYVRHGITEVGFNIEEIEGANTASSLAGGNEAKYRDFIRRFFALVWQAPGVLKVREFESALGHLLSDEPVRDEQNEPFAWRRLKRMLAELAADRRRADFELDRGLAEARGITRAS